MKNLLLLLFAFALVSCASASAPKEAAPSTESDLPSSAETNATNASVLSDGYSIASDSGEDVSNPMTIDEYKDAIAKYEKRIADLMEANSQIGIEYRILGSRYIDMAAMSLNRDGTLWGEALKCYQKAIEYDPDNPNLYYYVGLCAGYMANSDAADSTEKRNNYLALSESAYLRAIAIEPGYVRALYGLSVLYVFYLDRSADAIPYLEALLMVDTGHEDAKSLLARTYYHSGDFQKAIDMYDNIIGTTRNRERKASAEQAKKIVLDALYGKAVNRHAQ